MRVLTPARFPTYPVPQTRSKVNTDENMKVVASIESGTEKLVDRGTLYLDRGLAPFKEIRAEAT